MTFNLATILRQSASERGPEPLLHAAGRTLTYADVDLASSSVATALLARGLNPGDKVAVQLPNVPEFVLAYFGILKAGLVIVPLNPLFTAREIEYHLRDSDARVLITSTSSLPGAVVGANAAGVSDVILTEAQDSAGTATFDELLEAEPFAGLHPTTADDTAVLLYTSGTTGRPKGAELTHFTLFMNATMSARYFDPSPEDVTLGALPLFHVFGLSSVLNNAVRFGGSVALLPRFEATAALDAIERFGVTIMIGVPTMYVALNGTDISNRNVSTLRAAVSGGASIPGEVLRTFEEKYGATILEGYGLSETASSACFNISADQRKVLSIGKPIWGVEMAIAEAESGAVLPDGPENVGEVLVRGHCVMKGYYKRPEATAETIRDGWLHTGDLGYRDADGFYFIVDRLKDLVVRGGYNVYPREVEEVLYEHPDILEAAVVGRPDDRLGEEVVAYVALRPGASYDVAELTAFTKERLAAYKYPRAIHVVSEMPKGATGKILKRELREN